MKKVITKDDSITFFNEQVQDHYHCKSGARNEAFVKYADNVVDNSVIFDMFFGLGYNSAASLDLKKNLTILCFENDKDILKEILNFKANFESWFHIQSFIKNFLEKDILEYSFNNNKLIMFFGDARDKIKNIDLKADFVFFDPFSPSKVPELWSEDFFMDIKSKMKKHSKLFTYSCARWIRDNMQKAGFSVEDGPIIANHKSTIAKL